MSWGRKGDSEDSQLERKTDKLMNMKDSKTLELIHDTYSPEETNGSNYIVF
jgi:hypothetical protein